MNIVKSQGISRTQVEAKENGGDEFTQILAKMTGLKTSSNLEDTSESVLEENYGDEEEDLSLYLFIPSGIQSNSNQGIDIMQIQEIQNSRESLEEVSATIKVNMGDLDDSQLLMDVNKDFAQYYNVSKDFDGDDFISDYFASKEFDSKDLIDSDIIESNYLNSDISIEEVGKKPIINEAKSLNLEGSEETFLKPLNKPISTDKVRVNGISENGNLTNENALDINSKTKEEELMASPKNNDTGFVAHLNNSTSVEGVSKELTSSSPTSQSEIVLNENIQRVSDTLIDMIDLNVSDKGESMKVKLYPDELGYIDVVLTMEDGKLQAKILVGNEQVREMFNTHLNQLNQKLISQDINVERLDVDLNFNSYSGSGENNQQEPRKSYLNNYQDLTLLENSQNIVSNENYILAINGLSILA